MFIEAFICNHDLLKIVSEHEKRRIRLVQIFTKE